MDPLMRAIVNLKAEREKVAESRARVVRDRNTAKERGKKMRLAKLVNKYDDRLEITDYVLNILEHSKEE